MKSLIPSVNVWKISAPFITIGIGGPWEDFGIDLQLLYVNLTITWDLTKENR